MDVRTTQVTIDGVEGVFISLEDFQLISALEGPDEYVENLEIEVGNLRNLCDDVEENLQKLLYEVRNR